MVEKEMKTYSGTLLIQNDYRVIKEIEQAVIGTVPNISYNRLPLFGFSCRNGRITGLSLQKQGISASTHLLSTIGDLDHLEYLDISRISLQNLPSFLSNFKTLKVLCMNNCDLRSLPPLNSLTQLRTLSLYSNHIRELSDDLGGLRKLESLILAHNSVEILPEAIGKLHCLKYLTVRSNKLKDLPSSIGHLTLLEQIDVSYNEIIELPLEIGNLEALLTLDCANNRLSHIPATIGNLRSLVMLDLSKNQLQSLPPTLGNLGQLEQLNLEDNPLEAFPLEIGQLYARIWLDKSSRDEWIRTVPHGDDIRYELIDPKAMSRFRGLDYFQYGMRSGRPAGRKSQEKPESKEQLISEIKTTLSALRSLGKARMRVLDGTIASFAQEVGKMRDWEHDTVLNLHEALAKAELVVEIEKCLKVLRDQGKSTAFVLGRPVVSYAKTIGALRSMELGALSELHEALSQLAFRKK